MFQSTWNHYQGPRIKKYCIKLNQVSVILFATCSLIMIPCWLKYVAILNIMMYISDDERCAFCWLCGVNCISKELSSYACTNTVQSGQQFGTRLQRVLTELWNSNTYNYSPPSGNYLTLCSPTWVAKQKFSYLNSGNFPPFMKVWIS